MMMRDEMDEMCCKSVGTDLSMLDIDDFITEISQLKKEVALLEAKLRSRGDEGVKREDVDCCESSVYVTDGCLDSVWISRDQSRTPQPLLDSKLSEEKSRHTQDSELSLTLLCYTESKPTDAQDTVCDSNQGLQDEESTDQTSTESLDSVCNAGEQQQILQTTLKMCSVKLIDCRYLMMKIKTEPIEEEDHTDEDEDNHVDDFIPSDVKSESCSEGETSSTSKDGLTAQTLHDSKVHVKKLFHCEQCGMIFDFLSQLTVHIKSHSDFKCTECENYFSTKQNLDAHLCDKLQLHQITHTDEKPFKCSQCNKTFARSSLLRIHERTHTGEKPYKCSQCDKRFTRSGTLRIHEKAHTGEKPYVCSYCGKTFTDPSNFRVHERLHSGEKPYKCSQCDKMFNHSSTLRMHKKVHTGEKPYVCSHCGKKFMQSSEVRVHERIHTGEKPYKCSQCDKTFTNSSNLKVHERVHTGEKPYKCSHCDETFTHSGTVRIHERVHTREILAPYMASHCGKIFTNASDVRVHERVHTGEIPYKCSHCDKTFTNSGNLKVHERVHTGEKPYKCSHCDKMFAHSVTLRNHQCSYWRETLQMLSL